MIQFIKTEFELNLTTNIMCVSRLTVIYVICAIGSSYVTLALASPAPLALADQPELSQNDRKEAFGLYFKHQVLMKKEGACSLPVRRVVYVSEVMPNAASEFTPRATLLYRCSAHSGCCSNPRATCMPSTMVKVREYFTSAHSFPAHVRAQPMKLSSI